MTVKPVTQAQKDDAMRNLARRQARRDLDVANHSIRLHQHDQAITDLQAVLDASLAK
jgi:hypothetical protein